MHLIRTLGPPVLALLAVLLIDRSSRRRGLLPPRFRVAPTATRDQVIMAWIRRLAAMAVLVLILWVGVFAALGVVGSGTGVDPSQVSRIDLFLLHAMLVFCLMVWYAAGFLPREAGRPEGRTDWRTQLGFETRSIGREIGIGLVFGALAWLVVLGALMTAAFILWWWGGEALLPQEPPPLIPWIAALPLALRLAISLSAGVVEETFFRGFLQPRAGLVVSTALFVLAHASYEQPLMLIGIGLLSLIYGGLVYWRQSIWSAIAAHTLFDAVQLTVVIPAALKLIPRETVPSDVARWVFGLV